MGFAPGIIFIILAVTLVLFIWGHWRYDVVALLCLVAVVLSGVIPYKEAFSGLSNPAVITVAMVMVITRAIAHSGLVDHLVRRLSPATNNCMLHIATLTIIAAILSSFMNNVGALALVMPVAIQTAFERNRSPSLLLMPIAFGSILGGMTTLIGTPANMLVSAYRETVVGVPFRLFDFTPVGLVVMIAGIIFIVLLGWRLLPRHGASQKSLESLFQIKDYITEIQVPPESPLVGMTLAQLEEDEALEVAVLGLIRQQRCCLPLQPSDVFQAKDILLIETPPNALDSLLKKTQAILVSDQPVSSEELHSKDRAVVEALVVPGSSLEGRNPQQLHLRRRFGIHLLALSRQGKAIRQRLRHDRLCAGDVLLLQGEADTLLETVADLGFLPLAERGLHVGLRKGALLPMVIFAIALVVTALNILPVQMAFSVAVVAMIVLDVIPIRKVYESIDWSVLVLLAAMIPVGTALEKSGGSAFIAHGIAALAYQVPPIFIVGLLMGVTMTLSDVMNNAATAVVMAPIAVSIAQSLGYHPDPFLMAVAVGASSAFLTPIGHQNNTLVMGPGGYRFGDYWPMGLPLELLILVISLPLIVWVWPL